MKYIIPAVILGPSLVYLTVALIHAWIGETSNHPDDDTWKP